MRARMGGKLSKPKKNGYQSEKKRFCRDDGNLPVQCFIALCKLRPQAKTTFGSKARNCIKIQSTFFLLKCFFYFDLQRLSCPNKKGPSNIKDAYQKSELAGHAGLYLENGNYELFSRAFI